MAPTRAAADRERWDRDMARFNDDLKKVDAVFAAAG
jgi:hypothetical protein